MVLSNRVGPLCVVEMDSERGGLGGFVMPLRVLIRCSMLRIGLVDVVRVILMGLGGLKFMTTVSFTALPGCVLVGPALGCCRVILLVFWRA
jgi:hypothetical protein